MCLGTVGDKFYIILEGLVSILIPDPVKIARQTAISKGQTLPAQEPTEDEFTYCTNETKEKISLFSEFIALDSGKSFGEMALINNKPRGATILCKEDCHFATMGQEDYKSTLMKLEELKRSILIEFLRKQ